MSGTRSPFPTAHRTEPRAALIVAHGSPSAPTVPEESVTELAEHVAHRLPAWRVRGATLAGKGSLEEVLKQLSGAGLLVYPLFMSDGWFVSQALPRRLRQCWPGGLDIMAPLGLDPALTRLCLQKLEGAMKTAATAAGKTTVLIAAHGARADPRPRQAAQRLARHLSEQDLFREVRVGFLEERPFVEEVAQISGAAVCLPFFASRAGHVKIDLPAALAAASFQGHLIEPIGVAPEVPDIVAEALTRYELNTPTPVSVSSG